MHNLQISDRWTPVYRKWYLLKIFLKNTQVSLQILTRILVCTQVLSAYITYLPKFLNVLAYVAKFIRSTKHFFHYIILDNGQIFLTSIQ